MVSKALFSSKSDNWETPKWVLDKIIEKWGEYFDPCPLNNDMTKWDGLKGNWNKKKLNFVNPPFSKIKDWIQKAKEQYLKGCKIVLLIPARTDTKYFHEQLKYMYTNMIFLKGRLDFGNDPNSRATFPSVVIFCDKDQVNQFVSFENWR